MQRLSSGPATNGVRRAYVKRRLTYATVFRSTCVWLTIDAAQRAGNQHPVFPISKNRRRPSVSCVGKQMHKAPVKKEHSLLALCFGGAWVGSTTEAGEGGVFYFKVVAVGRQVVSLTSVVTS
jgi:hypothetical protein